MAWNAPVLSNYLDSPAPNTHLFEIADTPQKCIEIEKIQVINIDFKIDLGNYQGNNKIEWNYTA